MDGPLNEKLIGTSRNSSWHHKVAVWCLAAFSFSAIALFAFQHQHAASVQGLRATSLADDGCLLHRSATLPVGYYGLAKDMSSKKVRSEVYGPGEKGPFQICANESFLEYPAVLTYDLDTLARDSDGLAITFGTRLTADLDTRNLYHIFTMYGESTSVREVGHRYASNDLLVALGGFDTHQCCVEASAVREGMQEALNRGALRKLFSNIRISEISFQFPKTYVASMCSTLVVGWQVCDKTRSQCEAKHQAMEAYYQACLASNRDCKTQQAAGRQCQLQACQPVQHQGCVQCPSKREYLNTHMACGQSATSFGC